MPIRNRLHKATHPHKDWATLILCLLLAAFGVILIFNASNVEGFVQFNDKYHFAKLQLTWLSLGLIMSVAIASFPLPLLKKISPALFLVTLILLILVIIPGIGTKVQGARRWLVLGGFRLQPSELVKLTLSLYLPALFIRFGPHLSRFSFITGIVMLLLLLEPDMGTAMIIFTIAAALFFILGAKIKDILIFGLISFMAIGMLIVSSPYRLDRLKTFLEPTTDPLGTSYHIRQVLISLGSGGWFGTGIGRSLQKYQYLPEASTDSIFAVLSEETGLVGGLVVIGLFTLIIFRGFKRISLITDPYAKGVAVAVMVWIGIQALGNIAAMVALIPLTGIPLPFLSYGGSSLLTTLLAIGLYVNASQFTKPQGLRVLRRRT